MDIATHFSPAKEVGGDYYDLSLKNNNLSVTIADVSGKGVPAAFLMALSRSMLKLLIMFLIIHLLKNWIYLIR